jgi:hypothetical protein
MLGLECHCKESTYDMPMVLVSGGHCHYDVHKEALKGQKTHAGMPYHIPVWLEPNLR